MQLGERCARGRRDRRDHRCGELAQLRATGPTIGMPLRVRRSKLDRTTAGRGVAAQLPRPRRRRPPDPTSDVADPATLGAPDGDLLTLREGQVAPRQWGCADGRHPATLTEPAGADRGCNAGHRGCVLARQAATDRLPELLTMLTSPPRRPTRRPHRTTHRPDRPLTLRRTHRTPPRSRCCEDPLIPPSTPPTTTSSSATATRSGPPSAAPGCAGTTPSPSHSGNRSSARASRVASSPAVPKPAGRSSGGSTGTTRPGSIPASTASRLSSRNSSTVKRHNHPSGRRGDGHCNPLVRAVGLRYFGPYRDR